MRLFLTFLLLAVVLGGTTRGLRIANRPLLVLAGCLVFAALIYGRGVG